MRDETVLAFDFGLKRVGVAVGERRLATARALLTIAEAANEARFAAIDRLIDEWQPARLLVGRPLSVSGDPHEMTRRCERFARQLSARFRLPVDFADERYSSLEAERDMSKLSWQERKKSIDAEAARVILQAWFNQEVQKRDTGNTPGVAA